MLCCLVSLAAPLRAGNIYYASPTGSSSGDGSEEKPYDIATAVSKLAHYNYDEIRLLPGRYDLGAQILINKYDASLRGWGNTRDDVVLNGQGTIAPLKATARCVVSDLTVSNGYDTTGCAYISTDGILSNCVVRNCIGRGANIVTRCLVYDCDFRDCTGGGYGVGVQSDLTCKLYRCNIFNNFSNSQYGSGIQPGGAMMFDCYITNNVCSSHGGGMSAQTLLAQNCVFADNVSSNTGGAAYIVKWNSITSVFDRCTFVRNRAKSGGGAVYSSGKGCDAIFSNCVFTANEVFNSGSGGAVLGTYPSDAPWLCEFHGCAFTNNVSKSNGGAICINDSNVLGVLPIRVRGCVFTSNTCASAGGAIGFAGKLFSEITDCTFDGNVATTYGGAVGRNNNAWNNAEVYVTCSNCVYIGNRAQQGGAFFSGGSIYGCSFTGNMATNTSGTIEGGAVDFIGKRVSAAEIAALDWTNLVVGCGFTNNVCHGNGSAVYCSSTGGTFIVRDTIFKGNHCSASGAAYGGAFAPSASHHFEAERCQFIGNTTYGSRSMALDTGSGKGAEATNVLIRQCYFFGNRSFDGHSGSDVSSVYLGATNSFVDNCTFVSNITAGLGSVLHLSSGDPSQLRFTNCLMWENRSGTSDILYRYGVFGASYNTTVPDVCFNCFNQQGHVFGTSATQWSVNNNLGGKLNDEYIDPGMVDWANGDCRPASKKSAVVDKGVTQPWMTAGKVTDLAGENRLYGVAVDIGCYEYRPEVIGTLFSCR